MLLYQGSSGLDSLQNLSDGVIANELDSIHGHQDAAHDSSQATASDKGVVEGAKDQTASALKYAEDQLRQKSDKVHCAHVVCNDNSTPLLPLQSTADSLSNLICRRTLKSRISRTLWQIPLRMPKSLCSPLTPNPQVQKRLFLSRSVLALGHDATLHRHNTAGFQLTTLPLLIAAA